MNPRQGGSYAADKPGAKPKLQHRTNQPVKGNAPRAADGRRLDRPDQTAPEESPKPAAKKEKE